MPHPVNRLDLSACLMIGGRRRSTKEVLDDLALRFTIALPARLLAADADCSAARILHLRTTGAFASAAILRLATLLISMSINKKHSKPLLFWVLYISRTCAIRLPYSSFT